MNSVQREYFNVYSDGEETIVNVQRNLSTLPTPHFPLWWSRWCWERSRRKNLFLSWPPKTTIDFLTASIWAPQSINGHCPADLRRLFFKRRNLHAILRRQEHALIYHDSALALTFVFFVVPWDI